jgi:hypothetical protein
MGREDGNSIVGANGTTGNVNKPISGKDYSVHSIKTRTMSSIFNRSKFNQND